jgi:hypothetical protein
MKGNLRIGWLIEGIGWANRLCLAETIDLNDPGRNAALVDCQTRPDASPADRIRRTECHQPPVSGLHARRADALIPDLGRF